ncbi:MAG TPA: glutamate--tRNA ligase family protein [Candidatus Paceibacterota bacterium]
MNTEVRVRFPPSPTGYCHVGTARMAILNYLFAKKHGGKIIFRSEDTDKERSKKEFEDDIVEQLHWIGLEWDEFYRTTELVERHKTALSKLIAEDKAYVSEEESKKNPGTMTQVVRLRNPGRTITFSDEIRGDITFDTTELKDFVIARSIDDPLYNFAVVVDDSANGITHVIRGEDHISNTPRQILIQESLGYVRPVYAHYPLFLGADKSKLSKRTGDVAVRDYREAGYLSNGLLNYMAILGWTPPSEREVMSLEEMIGEFDLKDLHKSGAVFDIEKLRWYNRQYLQRTSDKQFAAYALPVLETSLRTRNIPYDASMAQKLMPIIRERIDVSEDIATLTAGGEFDFFFAEPQLDVNTLPQKGISREETAKHLVAVHGLLTALSADTYTEDVIKTAVWKYAEKEGRGAVLWPLRYALSGRQKSPDPFTIAACIGKEATLRRITTAQKMLGV